MIQQFACLLSMAFLAVATPDMYAQGPQEMIQQIVRAERAANQIDHSRWLYLDDLSKPKEHTLQWVAGTQQGDVQRALRKDNQVVSEGEQRGAIDKFLHDSKAQNKEINEARHDEQQIDDFLKLLPGAFLWTQTGATADSITLHFEPSPAFHPPTREARVFSSMSGDLVADKEQHRVAKMTGHLTHDVSFGGGLLGKLKEGSSFALEQAQVGPSLWQLTVIQVHLQGSALLFKSISLQQDEQRSRFKQEPDTITLDQAAALAMSQPATVAP